MLAKAAIACLVFAMTLAGLGLTAAQLSQGQETQSRYLELLTAIFVIGCFAFLAASVLSFVAFVLVWIYRYFHAVQVMPGQWYPHYWPLQRIAQVTGVLIKHENWAGRFNLICQAQFGTSEATFTRTLTGFGVAGTYGIEFPQQPVDFLDDPKEGDTATIVVKAIPRWWRGRPAYLIQQAAIGVTDNRPAESSEQSQSSPDMEGSPTQ